MAGTGRMGGDTHQSTRRSLRPVTGRIGPTLVVAPRGRYVGPMSAELLPILDVASRRLALIVGEHRLSVADLAAAAAEHRAFLRDLGVRPGDRVGVVAEGSVEAALALVGNATYGVVSVPLNPKLGRLELDHILDDAAPTLILSSAAWPTAGWERPLRKVAFGVCAGEVGDAVEAGLGDGADGLDGGDAAPERSAGPDSPLLILYTSGTTGAPKGAVLTVGNVASNLDGLAVAWAWSEADRVVHALPLFHVHGLVLGLFGALRAGACLHWIPRFDPRTVLQALAGGGTMLFAVPTMHHRIAEYVEQTPDLEPALAEGLRSARLLISGSAALSGREHQRLARLSGTGVYERYGLTETLINCAVRVDGPPLPGYVGPALPGVELRLVDDLRRPTIPADDRTIGEVAVRGPNVFVGYLHRPEATAEVLDAEGWFYTGDLATWREDGAVRIVGRRATDLIKCGGYKIGAGEVEGALLEHPAVREAAVIGAPDGDLGERIVAFVVVRDGSARPSAETLIDWVAGLLAPHKRPRAVVFAEALPRNPMGKVTKGALKEQWAAQG